MVPIYSTVVYSALQNTTNHIISEGNPTDVIFGGEICSSKEPILVSISKNELSSLKEQVFFSNLTDDIDHHLIQKIIFMSYLITSMKLKFELFVAFVITKV